MNGDTHNKPCCGPDRPAATVQMPAQNIITARRVVPDAVSIAGGSAMVGTKRAGIPDDGESPLRQVRVPAFVIAATTVTNAQFSEFIKATGYVTEAEHFGWSFVFWQQLPAHTPTTRGVGGVEWWRLVDGAVWHAPNGPDSHDACLPDHPVVQVSWNDACAYAKWVGGRLPTEAEWEHAARGGQGDVTFPWGDAEPDDAAFTPCNIWQGRFPDMNTARDGFVTTAPARSYQPNPYGLYNMVGNVWEWTADTYRIKSLKKQVRTRLAGMKGYKLSKGGSFLCHKSYCYRYRIAARSGSSPDSATTHQGFRVVWDV